MNLRVITTEKTGELDFSTFLTIMHRQIQQEEPKTEILAALRMFDKQKRGYIPASELRAKLTMMGEKLTNKEGKNECWNQNVAVKYSSVSPTDEEETGMKSFDAEQRQIVHKVH